MTERVSVMKILVVFGTRPEAIKMCPVIKELKIHDEIETIVCVTGQHKEMLNPILDTFQISADYNMDIMRSRQSLFDITKDVLIKMRAIVQEEKPDIVLVHGDTTSAFAAALASFYMKIPVCHVEAGLRTYDQYSPYPEEFNRQAVDAISALFFAPTEAAKNNLIKEGKIKENIYVTGNTAIDALDITVSDQYTHELLQWADKSRLILLTAHRRENLGSSMINMFSAVRETMEEFEDIKVICPMHLNPDVREIVREQLGSMNRVKLAEPLDVVDFHNIMKRSYMEMTDSGGIQEEAPALGKPVLVMRNTTERPEGVRAGTLKLIGTEKESIKTAMCELLTNKKLYQTMAESKNPYGDGKASKRIVQALLDRWEKQDVWRL